MHRTLLVALVVFFLPGSARAQNTPGSILWRFEMASPYSGDEVAVGPDGTVYASDNTQLYALRPDGALKWTRPGAGGGTPIGFLAGGVVVVGLGETVYALDPADGSDVWTYRYDSNGFREQIEVGPSIGPDGNIYGVTSTDGTFGLGAFSLTPGGQLRWSDEGQPQLNSINAGTGGAVHFTSDRAIFPFNTTADGAAAVYGYDLDGNQTLYLDSCSGPPRTDSLDRLLVTSSCGISALEQDGNQTFWTVRFGAVTLPPAIASDAALYSGAWLGSVSAVNPDGSTAWTSTEAVEAERMLAVRRDRGVLVYSGGGFGEPNFVSGVHTADGSLAWTLDLAGSGSLNELVWTYRAATSADGSTVYLATRFTSNGVPGALYAVRMAEPAPGTVGLDGILPGKPTVVAVPNPFRAATEFHYTLEAPATVRIDLFDSAGRLVRTLPGGPPGWPPAWNGRDGSGNAVEAGVYFYRMLSAGGAAHGRVILLR